MEGFLDIGGTRLVNVCYLPTKIKHYSEPIYVYLENGSTKTITLEGEAHNENVHISKSYIKMDDTYMILTTSKNIKIVNHTP